MLCEQNKEQYCDYITDLILRIDKIQKDVLDMGDSVCIGCEIALLSSTYNTIPITIYTTCGDTLTAILDLTEATTNVFRIESVKCNKYVTLRLLEITTDPTPVIVGTNRTMVLDMSKIIGLQCYEPITVEACTSTT